MWLCENGAKYTILNMLVYPISQQQKNDKDDKDDEEDDEHDKDDEDYDNNDEDDEDDKDYEDDQDNNEDIFSHQTKVAGTISSTRRWFTIRVHIRQR